jgi:hypothetical protein
MDRMKNTAKLFQNSLVQMHSIIGRMQASLLAIVYALISSIMAFVDSVKVTLIVAIIVIGILVSLMFILFFLLLPISGLIITMTFVLSLVVVAVGTAIAAAMVSELFVPGACFRAGTRVAVVVTASTSTGAPRRSEARPIEEVRIGDALHGGGRVTAVHRFLTRDPVYDVHGVQVTGDHLIYSGAGGQLIPVREYPDARIMPRTVMEILRHGGRVAGAEEVWCLTTTNRRIPCVGHGGSLIEFADWEEIPDDAEDQQRAWHTAVQQTLNGETASVDSVVSEMSESEAALHPHTEVLTREGGWMRVGDVRLGEQIRCGDDVWATVLGRVEMTPDVVEESTTADGVSTGCWVWNKERRIWSQPAGASRLSAHTDHWIHLYTSTGTVWLRGLAGGGQEVLVRDASDVGLERIGAINDVVVLGRQADKSVPFK